MLTFTSEIARYLCFFIHPCGFYPPHLTFSLSFLTACSGAPIVQLFGAVPAADALIVGGLSEAELFCGLRLVPALEHGSLLLTPGGVTAGGSVRGILAQLLHVSVARVMNLASGHVGFAAPSSAAFRTAYARVGGAAAYAPLPWDNARAAIAADAVGAFSVYCLARGHLLPVGHSALVVGMPAPAGGAPPAAGVL